MSGLRQKSGGMHVRKSRLQLFRIRIARLLRHLADRLDCSPDWRSMWQSSPISANILWDDYYENLHFAYNAMRSRYADSGLTQEEIAFLLNVDKSLISKRLNGNENLTLKSMSHMGTAMECRLLI
ncbi:MAG: hypothetical protein WCD69_13630, partial [Xanthobacteraceae bacterium]